MLIDEFYIPKEVRADPLYAQYEYVCEQYKAGHKHIILNNTRVFAPFPKANKAGDISELQKLVIYNPELRKLNHWIMSSIVINLGKLDYKTRGVLTRIATGMLNKINIPKDSALLLHANMCENIEDEHIKCVLSTLPF